jgi:hypothetical protein
MDKILIRCIIALLLGFTVLAGGCGKSQTDVSKEWTPAKAGMTHAQFNAMMMKQLQAHQAQVKAQGGTPGEPTAPTSPAVQ